MQYCEHIPSVEEKKYSRRHRKHGFEGTRVCVGVEGFPNKLNISRERTDIYIYNKKLDN